LAAHRYHLGGAIVNSRNKLVLLPTRRFESFSFLGRIGFMLVMLVWTLIFFGAFAIPLQVALFLKISKASPSISYSFCAFFGTAVVALVLGPSIWRKLALKS
jgi:hypothetical protein